MPILNIASSIKKQGRGVRKVLLQSMAENQGKATSGKSNLMNISNQAHLTDIWNKAQEGVIKEGDVPTVSGALDTGKVKSTVRQTTGQTQLPEEKPLRNGRRLSSH